MPIGQKQDTFFKINYALLLLTAGTFFFSRYLFLSIAIVWLVVAIGEWNWKERYISLKQSGMLYLAALFLLFYVLYILGPVISENTRAAISDWEYKIWFLACPICIMPFLPKLTRKQLDLALVLFTITFAIVTCFWIGSSILQYIRTGNPKSFLYTHAANLCIGMGHPSYCSLYEACAWLIAAEFLRKKNPWLENIHVKRAFIAAICLFSIHIPLLQSKMGVLTFGIIIAVYFIIIFCNSRKRIVTTCIIFGAICLAGILFVAKSDSRIATGIRNLSDISERVDNDPRESNAIRVAVWGNTMELIQDHWLTGGGNGDTDLELHKKAVEHNYLYIASGDFNCHCQYLQCWLGFGVAGLILLIAIIGYSGIIICKRKSLTSALILFTFAANMLVESMLEVYHGATIIPIFITIFTFRALLKPCDWETSESRNPSNPPLISGE